MKESDSLVVIGAGYTGKRLIRSAAADGWRVAGTGTSAETVDALEQIGAGAARWEADSGERRP
ncbi:MAG: hypothetical protein ABEL76_00130, partial [Bradymonadaceae bacterium]